MGGFLDKVGDWLWDHTGGVVVDTAANAVSGMIAQAIEFLVSAMMGAAYLLINASWDLASTAAAPNLNAAFLYTWVSRVFTISIPIMVILMIFQIILGAVKFSPKEIGRAFLGMGYAIIGTIVSLPIVAALQKGFDDIADWIIKKSLEEFAQGGEGLAELLLGGDMGAWMVAASAMVSGAVIGALAFQSGVTVIIGVLVGLSAGATFGLFMALQIRTMLLYIVLVVGPIMLAGAVFKKTAQWATRYMSIVLALIVTKLGVVIVFSLGLAIITDMAQGQSNTELEGSEAFLAGIGQLSAGILMLAMSTLVPYACFKFFDFAGEHLVEGLSANVKAVTDQVGQKTKQLSQTALNPQNAAAKLGVGGAAIAGAGAVVGASKAPAAAAGKAAGAAQTTGTGGSQPSPSQAQPPSSPATGQVAQTQSSDTQGWGHTRSEPSPTHTSPGSSTRVPTTPPPSSTQQGQQMEPAPAPPAVENVNLPPTSPTTTLNPSPQPGTIVNPAPSTNNPHLAPASHTDSVTDAVKNAVTGK